MTLKALGGGPLCGDKIVRELWLDESGIASIKENPWLVVGGVVIDMDKKYKKVEEHLHALARRHQKPYSTEPFVFHGHDIFHRNKYFNDPFYTRERIEGAFEDFCAVPAKFDLPVILQALDRAVHKNKRQHLSAHDLTVEGQVIASTACAVLAEKYVRTMVKTKGALIRLVYEQNLNSELHIKQMQERFQQKDFQVNLPIEAGQYLPLKRVIANPMFSVKYFGTPHQISDAIAFVFRRQKSGKTDADRFVNLYQKQMLTWK